MTSEKLCLQWNGFENNINTAFRELREDKNLFDVTLACDDEQIQAHKVVLSACSPFFRTVLKRNPHPHPLVYLKGVKFSNLQSILDFMYYGKVFLIQDELQPFLALAEDLQIVTQNTEHSSDNNDHHSRPNDSLLNSPLSKPPTVTDVLPPPEKLRQSSNDCDNNEQFVLPVMEKPQTHQARDELNDNIVEQNHGELFREDDEHEDCGEYVEEEDKYEADMMEMDGWSADHDMKQNDHHTTSTVADISPPPEIPQPSSNDCDKNQEVVLLVTEEPQIYQAPDEVNVNIVETDHGEQYKGDEVHEDCGELLVEEGEYEAGMIENDGSKLCRADHDEGKNEKHMEPSRHPCSFCQKRFKNRNSLGNHVRLFHRKEHM